jgi:hypothetical protein
MAHLTTPPGFATNKWPEGQWARAAYMTDGGLVVGNAGSWAPTVNGGATRSVFVAPGSATACGIYDESGATETFTFAANNGSAARYDAIVAVFDWVAKSVSFEVIAGTSSPPSINTVGGAASNTIDRLPGVRYDGLVALVRVRPGVTVFSAGDVLDMRVWRDSRGLVAAATEFLSMVDGYRGLSKPIVYSTTTPIAVWSLPVGDNNHREIGRLTIPDPGSPFRLRTYGGCELYGHNGARVDSWMSIDGVKWDFVPGWTNWHKAAGLSPVFTGAKTLQWFAYRANGTGNWTSTAINYYMDAEVVPA